MNLTPSTRPDPGTELLRDYDNMFRIFYNYAPALDDTNIANAYVECKALLTLADMYDCLEVVGPRVDHHLLQFQGRLWKQIAKYPPSYLKLGYLARSKIIFAEACTHVIGQWPLGEAMIRSQLPPDVVLLIEDKAEDLDIMKARVESRLFKLSATVNGARANPTSNWLEWLAVSLFRQWLAENLHGSPPPPLPNATRSAPPARVPEGRIFRLLHMGGESYLAHDELKRFLKLQPESYSRDNLRRFEKAMDAVKVQARELVVGLMSNALQMDAADGRFAYLTCMGVDEGEWPWEYR